MKELSPLKEQAVIVLANTLKTVTFGSLALGSWISRIPLRGDHSKTVPDP